MLHILSTHGFLLSFNLLNFQPTRVDICSPPQNLPDQSGLGLFRQNVVDIKQPVQISTSTQPLAAAVKVTPATSSEFQLNNLTFAIPETGATSTPAKQPQTQTKPTFGLPNTETPQTNSTATSLFGGTPTAGFGSSGFGLGGSKEVAKPFTQTCAPATASVPSVPQKTVANVAKVSTDTSKPFLTVQPNYKPASQTNK